MELIPGAEVGIGSGDTSFRLATGARAVGHRGIAAVPRTHPFPASKHNRACLSGSGRNHHATAFCVVCLIRIKSTWSMPGYWFAIGIRGRMKPLVTIIGYVRTVLVAALVLAFAGVGISSAHSMPCHDMLPTSSDVMSSTSNLSRASTSHPETAQVSEPGDAHPDRCCVAKCAICLAAFPKSADHEPPPHTANHGTESREHLAGITLSPRHGPPRS